MPYPTITHPILEANAATSIPAAPMMPDTNTMVLIDHRSAMNPINGATVRM